jgi:hypothetical protein
MRFILITNEISINLDTVIRMARFTDPHPPQEKRLEITHHSFGNDIMRTIVNWKDVKPEIKEDYFQIIDDRDDE